MDVGVAMLRLSVDIGDGRARRGRRVGRNTTLGGRLSEDRDDADVLDLACLLDRGRVGDLLLSTEVREDQPGAGAVGSGEHNAHPHRDHDDPPGGRTELGDVVVRSGQNVFLGDKTGQGRDSGKRQEANAEAGVGPSIASGSQSWNGNCADLPAMPLSRQMNAAVSRVDPGRPDQVAIRSRMLVVPAPEARMIRPMTKARSAKRVTKNALMAARDAESLRLLWPMSRYEHQPMTSQPTRVSTRSPDRTTSNMPARNSDTVPVKTP